MNTSKTKKYWEIFEKSGTIKDYLQYKMAFKKEINHETNSKESRGYNQN